MAVSPELCGNPSRRLPWLLAVGLGLFMGNHDKPWWVHLHKLGYGAHTPMLKYIHFQPELHLQRPITGYGSLSGSGWFRGGHAQDTVISWGWPRQAYFGVSIHTSVLARLHLRPIYIYSRFFAGGVVQTFASYCWNDEQLGRQLSQKIKHIQVHRNSEPRRDLLRHGDSTRWCPVMFVG